MFLKGKVHAGLSSYSSLRDWSNRSEKDNVAAMKSLIQDAVLGVDMPSSLQRTSNNSHEYMRLFVAAAAESMVGERGHLANTVPCSVTGKLRLSSDPETDFGPETSCDSMDLNGVFIHVKSGGLTNPSGVPSVQSILKNTSLKSIA
mgnify:FL=1